jgi:peptide/nickel transport system permease protein
MLRYTVRRLLQLVLVLLVLSLLLFVWLRSLPGGPVTALLGERATPAKRAELTAVLGLDQPIFVQYFKFLARMLRGDFGQSTGVSAGTPALDVFFTRFGATIELAVGAMIFGLVLGIPLGYMAAKRRAGALDNSLIVVSLIGIAVPVFFLAFLMKYLFAVKWGMLPPSGRQTPGIDATRVTGLFIVDGLITREWDASWDSVKHLILPWIALGTIPFAVIFRITRASVLEVQGEDFVRTAEAKGLTRTTIRNRHVLRNAMLPVITVTGLLSGLLLTGAVLTEKVFAYPGLGEALYIGFTKKDYPVVQVIILAAAAAFVIINTLVDLTYALVDPRIRAR